ncbi:hypothetical protein HU200_033003 [Digitaria exilis]|uniref:Pectinesterase inhibitor domain-containing protein n=1 Tax=Digitaria exilis TaxID=1010633 RepID=A0A835EP34_9POAL|nr:hypothetical protein HU200_033003 [Digitaria exilis]
MKLLQAIASLFFILVSFISTFNASTLHEVCRSLTTEHHKHTISYHDCVKFFQADKESATADKHGLAAIGAKIIGETAKSVADRIAHLRASEKDKERMGCLSECVKLYKSASAEIGKVAKGIALGTKGRLGDAATMLGTEGETMKLLQPLCALVFLLACSTSNASVLQDACKSFAAGHPEIGYPYCIKFFQADKGSAGADKRGLAAIAVRITEAAAKSAAKDIASLRSSEKDKRRLECLRACAEVYSSAVSEAAVAAKGIASGSGSGSGAEDAVTALSAVVDAPTTCEQGFQELHVLSPLAAVDAEFGKAASVALSVTAAL